MIDTNPPDMDSIPAVLDNVSGVDATMDITSHLDMVMTMMADLPKQGYCARIGS